MAVRIEGDGDRQGGGHALRAGWAHPETANPMAVQAARSTDKTAKRGAISDSVKNYAVRCQTSTRPDMSLLRNLGEDHPSPPRPALQPAAPQSALANEPPLQTMKHRHKRKPDPFNKQPHHLPGLWNFYIPGSGT